MNDNFDLLISGGSVYLPNNKIEESDMSVSKADLLSCILEICKLISLK